jgi:hypothetical protein
MYMTTPNDVLEILARAGLSDDQIDAISASHGTTKVERPASEMSVIDRARAFMQAAAEAREGR